MEMKGKGERGKGKERGRDGIRGKWRGGKGGGGS